MKRFIAMTAALIAALAIAIPASAGHDTNTSPRVATYTYDIGELDDSGAEGSVRMKALRNGKVQVKVEATGLAPNLPHAQHLHETTDGTPTECPPDIGQVTTVAGIPCYGGIQASPTVTGGTSPASALAVPRFPVSDAEGDLEYERTLDIGEAAFAAIGTLQYVVHGVDLNGSGAYDGEELSSIPSAAALGVPLEATIPAGCAGVLNRSDRWRHPRRLTT